MRTADYITATISLINEGRDFGEVLTNLKRVLEERGHQKLYRGILHGLLKATERKVKSQKPLVFLARESDLKKLETEIKTQLSKIEASDFESTIDDTLIGGYVIKHNNKILDNSYKSRLVTLYRSLTE